MRDDFCVFILTHGRPDRVITYKTLLNAGYTGRVYIVIDDEDKTENEYRARFGDKVLQFNKSESAKTFDEGDNFNDRRAIIYARNECWKLAEQVGCKYFIQFDDDYCSFRLRFNSRLERQNFKISNIDAVINALVKFYSDVNPLLSVAIAQGADLGSAEVQPRLRRKIMNSFICSTDRPFKFFGRINEDVNTYTTLGRRGELFFTVIQAQLNQKQTQSNPNGMTDLYLDSGTYVKSFYSVMYCPSSVQIGILRTAAKNQAGRLHHQINWNNTAPKIIRQEYKKGWRGVSNVAVNPAE